MTFPRIAALTSLPPNKLHSHRVKRQEKTKVQDAILTFFTLLTQLSGSAILLGRSDPIGFLGHETKAKTGVAPAQRGA